jgi:bla regulator protein blaR1
MGYNDTVFLPWQLNNSSKKQKNIIPATDKHIAPKVSTELIASTKEVMKIDIVNFQSQPASAEEQQVSALAPVVDNFIPVDFNAVDGDLTKEEKDYVKKTVDATKKVVSALKWKEIETSLAEVMDKKEKALAKQEFLQEIEKVNWQNVEQNLKANFDNINWQVIDHNMSKAMAQVQLDSLQNVYSQALTQLEKTERELKGKLKVTCTPIPDGSLDEIRMAKEVLRKNIDSIKAVTRPKKVVRL